MNKAGENQTVENLINEEALPQAKFLGKERETQSLMDEHLI